MADEAKVDGGATTTPAAVGPVAMTRAAAAAELGKLTGVEPEENGETTEETETKETAEETAEVKEEQPAETEPAATEAAEDGKLPEAAKAILQKRINEITGKSKAAVEAAQAEAESAKAEAAKLQAQAEAGRSEAIQRTGVLPELLEPAQADTLKTYDAALGKLKAAKEVLRFARAQLEGGQASGEDGQEKQYAGTGFDGKPFTGTARQWRDMAEDARDELDLTVRELAPQASIIKKTAAAQQAEIYKLGLAAYRQRQAAEAQVAAAAGEKGKTAAKVAVKPAAGAKPAATGGGQRGVSREQFQEAAKRDKREAATTYFAAMTG